MDWKVTYLGFVDMFKTKRCIIYTTERWHHLLLPSLVGGVQGENSTPHNMQKTHFLKLGRKEGMCELVTHCFFF
jgi:hypothetical protein